VECTPGELAIMESRGIESLNLRFPEQLATIGKDARANGLFAARVAQNYDIESVADESLREDDEPDYDRIDKLEAAFTAQLSTELVNAFEAFQHARLRRECWRRRWPATERRCAMNRRHTRGGGAAGRDCW
jgi:hypothetical protein